MHTLLKTMASHRVRKRLAVPSSGKRARLRSEEGERAMVMENLECNHHQSPMPVVVRAA